MPTIENNLVLFNQSFNQGTNPNGGGLAITGLQSLVTNNGLSAGTGTVLVNANTSRETSRVRVTAAASACTG